MKKEDNNLAYVAMGITLVILLFMVLMSSYGCKTKENNCLTFDYQGKSVICLNNDCDTVSSYYYNPCSNCITYEKDSATIFMCGRFTTENIEEIQVKPVKK